MSIKETILELASNPRSAKKLSEEILHASQNKDEKEIVIKSDGRTIKLKRISEGSVKKTA